MASSRYLRAIFLGGFLHILFAATAWTAETFRVATYNLENYLDEPAGTRPLDRKSTRLNSSHT